MPSAGDPIQLGLLNKTKRRPLRRRFRFAPPAEATGLGAQAGRSGYEPKLIDFRWLAHRNELEISHPRQLIHFHRLGNGDAIHRFRLIAR